MKFTEEKLEQVIIELLQGQGYPHIKGDSIIRDPNEVLIKEDLRKFLSNKYVDANITTTEIDSIIRTLENYSASDLYETNKTIMKMVSDGFLLKREDHTQKDLYIQLIDYSDLTEFFIPSPEDLTTIGDNDPTAYNTLTQNIYKIVNQLEIYGYEKRIPDGILYINGLPLVVFEFKSAIREKATIHDAYVQLTTRYRRDIPELFKYNAFCVISDGVNNRVGSFFADYEYYNIWARAPSYDNPHLNPLPGGEDLNSHWSSSKRGECTYRGNFDFSGLVKIARDLRKKQTPVEEVMWELVRNRQLSDLKFRRQHQIGPYIVDFFCDEMKLVVELDGGVHSEYVHAQHDHKRDAYLHSLGFTVLRFDNNDFLNDPASTLKQIAAFGSPSPVKSGNTSSSRRSEVQSSSPPGRGGGEGRGVEAHGFNSLFTMIEGLFNQHTLRDVIRNFIYFPDTSRKEEKIVCRYPQYYGAKSLYKNIKKNRRPEGDGKGGTYFGATGCGKSYTMLFLTRLLMRSVEFASPTIVLITDRTDLDDQLSGQFTAAKGFIGDNLGSQKLLSYQ